MSISHDNRLLASGSDDKTIMLWDLDTGSKIQTLIGHENAVCSRYVMFIALLTYKWWSLGIIYKMYSVHLHLTVASLSGEVCVF